MPEPAYVSVAGEYARRIRNGELAPGAQLPSYAEIAQRSNVSDIVVRKAVKLLQSQCLVRSVRRRGVFVTDRPNLVRVSPERQMEDPEASFRNESDQDIHVARESERTPAGEDLAQDFGIAPGDEITHIITRTTEDGRPISVSDTYQPLGVVGISDAKFLEETVADRLPISTHAAWLRTTPGDLVKTIHQRFTTADDKVVMVSNISFPRDRYDAFVFRMALSPDSEAK